MEIFVQEACAETVKTDVTIAELPEILRDESNFVWVDLEAPTRAEEDEILAGVFQFHELTIEDCRLDYNQPKVEAFPNYLYFNLHGVMQTTNSRNFSTKEIDIFLGKNFLVTYHHQPFQSIESIKKSLIVNPLACQRGGAFLLHQILDKLVDLYIPVIEDFDSYMTTLEDRIFRLKKSSNRVLAEIVKLKRNLIRLRRISSLQMDILYRISHGEFPQIDQELLPFYRDVYDHLARVSALSESYREIAGSLMDTYLSILSNRTNDVMKALTLLSAIMLPLTVITGIYGMNFENMPELKWEYGYFYTLGVMAVVVIFMFTLFYVNGWILNRENRDDRLHDNDIDTTLSD